MGRPDGVVYFSDAAAAGIDTRNECLGRLYGVGPVRVGAHGVGPVRVGAHGVGPGMTDWGGCMEGDQPGLGRLYGVGPVRVGAHGWRGTSTG